MAPHSSTLAWKIPWTEEPGGLQSMGSLRVGHDWATSLSLFTVTHWRRKWQPTPVFLPGESQGRGSLVAAVCGITQSRTQLKWLGSSSSKQLVHDSYGSTTRLQFWSTQQMALEGTFTVIVMLFFVFLFTWTFGLNLYSRTFIFVVPIFIHFFFNFILFLNLT